MNEIVTFITENPVTVLTDAARYSEFYKRIKAEVSTHVPDLTTKKGRDAIKSLAFRVVRTKTAIDDAGKKLNEDARAQINAVDASRRKIREELDVLAEEVRRPLTEWEDAEIARQKAIQATYQRIQSLVGGITLETDSEAIQQAIDGIAAVELDEAVFQDELNGAAKVKAHGLETLGNYLARAQKNEADQRELARLRAEQEERERVEREARERAAAELLAKEREEREAAEQKAREERAAQLAREEEQRKAQAAIQKAEREKAEAIAKAEAEARAVREKAEREERARVAEAERIKREDEARAADRNHRSQVMGEAKGGLIALGIDEEPAKRIVLAIVAGEIPHVSLRF